MAAPQLVPTQLKIIADSSDVFGLGIYELLKDETANGQPLWKLKSTTQDCWIFSGVDGKWYVGDESEKDSNFECSSGLVASFAEHLGKHPHQLFEWQRLLEDGQEWIADPSIRVIDVPERPSASKSKLNKGAVYEETKAGIQTKLEEEAKVKTEEETGKELEEKAGTNADGDVRVDVEEEEANANTSEETKALNVEKARELIENDNISSAITGEEDAVTASIAAKRNSLEKAFGLEILEKIRFRLKALKPQWHAFSMKLQKDGSGYIVEEDFLHSVRAVLKIPSGEARDSHVKLLFRVLDHQGIGRVSAAALEAFVAAYEQSIPRGSRQRSSSQKLATPRTSSFKQRRSRNSSPRTSNMDETLAKGTHRTRHGSVPVENGEAHRFEEEKFVIEWEKWADALVDVNKDMSRALDGGSTRESVGSHGSSRGTKDVNRVPPKPPELVSDVLRRLAMAAHRACCALAGQIRRDSVKSSEAQVDPAIEKQFEAFKNFRDLKKEHNAQISVLKTENETLRARIFALKIRAEEANQKLRKITDGSCEICPECGGFMPEAPARGKNVSELKLRAAIQPLRHLLNDQKQSGQSVRSAPSSALGTPTKSMGEIVPREVKVVSSRIQRTEGLSTGEYSYDDSLELRENDLRELRAILKRDEGREDRNQDSPRGLFEGRRWD